MKLNTESVNKYLLKTLKQLQSEKLFDDHYLVGGTALSLQIGHRISEDIDLFTNKKMDRDAILNYIRKNIDENVKIINNQGSIFQLMIEKEKLKIDFVELPYGLIDPLIEVEGIRMIGKNDLAAMKVSATGTRGYEAKDFYDLYFLLNYMTIDKVFDNFKTKYGTDDILHYVRSVIFFDDVPKESWEALKPVQELIPQYKIKERLTREVIEFEKRMLQIPQKKM